MQVQETSISSTTEKVSTGQEAEKFNFESNVSRVMDIIINSLYSNKDVFIRELISNAADACDKKRFLSLTVSGFGSVVRYKIDDPYCTLYVQDSAEPAKDLGIRVYPNREQNTLTIEDRGIGMNKEDLIQNLGRIAESGTKRFMESMGKNKDAVSLIGQFGVGFYSGFLVRLQFLFSVLLAVSLYLVKWTDHLCILLNRFLFVAIITIQVANKMEVITKGSKGEQLRWVALADSLDQYTIEPDFSEPLATTGTRIVLHLKDESDQYLDDVALRSLIEKYSEFIPFPIE